MRLDSAKNLAIAVIGTAMVATMIMPRRNTAQVLNSMMTIHSGTIRAAIGRDGTATFVDTRSSAERYQDEAYAALSEFWEGFNGHH